MQTATTDDAARTACPPWREMVWVSALVLAPPLLWLASLGGLSISWDMLNHHVYLGWMAVEGSRLTQDLFAAGSMSCQYPYAYAPLYWLVTSGATGQQAALALALPAAASVPALWLMAWALWPQPQIQGALLRLAWTALAFLAPLWWTMLDSSSNDLLSAWPVLWAWALAVWRASVLVETPDRRAWADSGWLAVAGALCGVAVVLKLSQVFAMLAVVLVLAFGARTWARLWRWALAFAAGGLLVAALLWWPWARTVWKICGSPFYPLLLEYFLPWSGRIP